MRIVFLGTSDYGEPALRALVRDCFDVAAVVTQPDRKCGRGLHAAPCAIKRCALELGLEVVQPESVNAPEQVSFLKSLKPDLLVVIAYGQILSAEVLNIPAVMPINIHGSLLPAYRGPAPVNRAVINGETVTGNSLMKVVRKMDAGPVIMKRERRILAEDDALTLERKLSEDAAGLLIDGLRLISSGAFPLEEQDESRATYAPKLSKKDGLIDWSRPAGEIRDRVRGLAGWPGSFSFYRRRMVKIFPPVTESDTARPDAVPGTITGISREAVTVACGSGALSVSYLQPEGKRRMGAGEFIAGHKPGKGERFGGP